MTVLDLTKAVTQIEATYTAPSDDSTPLVAGTFLQLLLGF